MIFGVNILKLNRSILIFGEAYMLLIRVDENVIMIKSRELCEMKMNIVLRYCFNDYGRINKY